MALESNGILEAATLDVSKSKGRNKKDGGEVEAGCWASTFRFFGSIVSSRSKVDTSTTVPTAISSGPPAPFGNSMFPLSELVCALHISRSTDFSFV